MRTFSLFFCLAAGLTAATSDPAPDTTRLFKVRCGACHGADGAGGVGPSLKGKLAHPSEKELFSVIKNGIPGTSMPPTPLPDPQVKKLVSYVQFINKQK